MFTVSVDYGPSFVLIACAGPATVAEICGALAFGAEIARREGRLRFLFDLLAVDFDGTAEDRKEMGLFAASLLGQITRIAVVLTSAANTGEGERSAREAGLELRNFTSLFEAIEWMAT
jgi:hypothetical protein